METLKNIGYVVVSVLGIFAVIAFGGILATVGTILGAICLGGFIVTLVAVGIKEHCETKDKDTEP